VADNTNPEYTHLSDEERFWEHRWPKILEEVKLANASVVCLQEIKQELFPEMKEAFGALGYEAVSHKKMQRNSLAVFFKQSKLVRVWEKNIRIKGFEKTLAVGLEYDGRTIAVVNCHLEGHPEKSLQRIEQLEKTLSEVKLLPHDAVLVVGDFNAALMEGPSTAAVSSYLSQGTVPPGTTENGFAVSVDPSLKHHGFDLTSAYGPGPAVSCIIVKQGPPALVDHIWFSHQLELIGVRDVFFDSEFRYEALLRGLPNLRNPSDHLPIGAVFRWR